MSFHYQLYAHRNSRKTSRLSSLGTFSIFEEICIGSPFPCSSHLWKRPGSLCRGVSEIPGLADRTPAVSLRILLADAHWPGGAGGFIISALTLAIAWPRRCFVLPLASAVRQEILRVRVVLHCAVQVEPVVSGVHGSHAHYKVSSHEADHVSFTRRRFWAGAARRCRVGRADHAAAVNQALSQEKHGVRAPATAASTNGLSSQPGLLPDSGIRLLLQMIIFLHWFLISLP